MTRTGIAAGLGCLMACSGQAVADIQIDVGCFSNVNPVPACEYEGDYAAFITSWEVEGYTSTQGYTMIDIDIAGKSTLTAFKTDHHLTAAIGIITLRFHTPGDRDLGAVTTAVANGLGLDTVGIHSVGLEVRIGEHLHVTAVTSGTALAPNRHR